MTAARRQPRRTAAPAAVTPEPERAPKAALGMLETRGLAAMFEGVDAMLKAANVTFTTWEPVGSGLVTAFVEGEVAAVKAATDAGAEAAKQLGEVVSVLVIPRPHEDLNQLMAKIGPKRAAQGVA